MIKLKRLDLYIFLRFIEVFFATFFISSFVLLMQFMWSHINDIVGKGLEFSVIFEFFFYSSLTVVPLALPLAILLASLMTFGNLGEKMELTAMKAAGISLFRIMASLTTTIVIISVSAFFFSNNVLPITQKKLWTLIFSLRQTSPELEIPAGQFYSGISGFNIYVREKDNDKKLLKEIMIYDFSQGFDNASVTVADSARLQMATDKTYLLITLYNGESFENLKQATSDDKNIPYRRENFKFKQVTIDFNSNFSRLDEAIMENDYMSKNLLKLGVAIDSINACLDKAATVYSQNYKNEHFFCRKFIPNRKIPDLTHLVSALFVDSMCQELTVQEKQQVYSVARFESQFLRDEISTTAAVRHGDEYIVIRHGIEWHRKLTLPFACIIFFFIGAPLGAIIRKGGLGVPVVISVLFFIVYYVIDNSGYKLARDNVWPVWMGIWLSSICILPVGLVFTYKAAKDSPIFNAEAYGMFIDKVKKLFKIRKKVSKTK